MNLEQKKAVVEDLKGIVESAKAMVLLTQSGLSVRDVTKFRAELRQEGAGLRVFKNTLLNRVVEDTGLAFISKWLTGPLAVAHTAKDPAAMAKVLTAFLKDHKNVVMVGGSLGVKPIAEANLKALANLPSAEVLKGMLLGTLVGVPKKLLGVFQAPGRDFVGVLAARQRQLEEQAA